MKKKILIIDDDTSLTYSLQRAFMKDYDILTANCASAGMRLLESETGIGWYSSIIGLVKRTVLMFLSV